jgi:hypothetical protein
MNVERMERIICSAARLYREVNKPLVRSRIDMTHDFYADEEADEPMLSVDVKGEPKVKLLDLVVYGSAVLIFLSIVSKIHRFLRRH